MLWRTILLIATLALLGCIDSPHESPLKRTTSLYKRLGGEPKLEQITDAFLDEVVLSDRIARETRSQCVGAKRASTRERVLAELTRLTKGSLAPIGEDASESILTMNIKNPDSVAILGALQAALKACQVPQRDAEDLMNAIAPPPA